MTIETIRIVLLVAGLIAIMLPRMYDDFIRFIHQKKGGP